jgi:hypothetical protein
VSAKGSRRETASANVDRIKKTGSPTLVGEPDGLPMIQFYAQL